MAIWMLIKRTPPCPLLQPLRHCLSRKKKPAPLWSVSRNPPEAGKSWKIWKGNPWVESSWTPVESLDLPPDFGKHHPVGFTAGHVTFQNSRKFGSHPRAFFFGKSTTNHQLDLYWYCPNTIDTLKIWSQDSLSLLLAKSSKQILSEGLVTPQKLIPLPTASV